MKKRLRRWKEGDYENLWREAVQITKPPTRSAKKKGNIEEKTLDKRNAARASQLAQDGQYKRSLQALDSSGMAVPTKNTEEEMRKKHPQAAGPSTFKRTDKTTSQLQFTTKEVKKAALSFKRGSAPGPSGLRPEHLSVTLKGAPANRTDRAGAALRKGSEPHGQG